MDTYWPPHVVSQSAVHNMFVQVQAHHPHAISNQVVFSQKEQPSPKRCTEKAYYRLNLPERVVLGNSRDNGAVLKNTEQNFHLRRQGYD